MLTVYTLQIQSIGMKLQGTINKENSYRTTGIHNPQKYPIHSLSQIQTQLSTSVAKTDNLFTQYEHKVSLSHPHT